MRSYEYFFYNSRICILSNISLLNLKSLRLFSCVAFKGFIVLMLKFRFLDAFVLIFMCSVWKRFSFILLLVNSQLSQCHLLKKTNLLLTELPWHPAENQLTINVRAYFLTQNSVLLCFCSYANITLSFLLQLCSKFWNWEIWVL